MRGWAELIEHRTVLAVIFGLVFIYWDNLTRDIPNSIYSNSYADVVYPRDRPESDISNHYWVRELAAWNGTTIVVAIECLRKTNSKEKVILI